MALDKHNPVLIAITRGGVVIGKITTAEFRLFMDSDDFIGDLVQKFNDWKEYIGEPERAEQVLNVN